MKYFSINTMYGKYKKCCFSIRKYSTKGNVCLQIFGDCGEGFFEPIMTVTENINKKLPEGNLAIKDYSENAGILREMKRLGFVTEICDTVASGFATIHVVKANMDKIKEYSC